MAKLGIVARVGAAAKLSLPGLRLELLRRRSPEAAI